MRGIATIFVPSLVVVGLFVARPPAAVADAEEPVHASWKGATVESIAGRLGNLAGMPVIVDRRIDPTLRVDLDADGRSVGEVLDEVARLAGGELATLRHSFRICPVGSATRVTGGDAARAARLATLEPKARDALASRQSFAWEAGTPPQELVERLAAEAGLLIDAGDGIPHDHLPAGSLMPLSLSERLDLVLAHYDLRVEPRGRRGLRIAPLDAADGTSGTSGTSGTGGTGGADRKRSAAQRPDRRDRVQQGEPAAATTDRYTLRAEATLEDLLRAVAGRFGLSLTLDHDSLAAKGVAPGEIVRLDVEDAPRSRILDAITQPRSLSWSIDGTTLKVR